MSNDHLRLQHDAPAGRPSPGGHRVNDPDHAGATAQAPHRYGGIAWWPSALGLGLALIGGVDSGTSATLASVVAVIALIYLAAAATGRRLHAWFGFLLSIPVVLAGMLTDHWATSYLIMAIIAVGLLVVGAVRGAWAEPINRVQLFAFPAFLAIAVAGALTGGTLAAWLIAGGLLVHSVWDIVHHRCDLVVGRRYAELCAALDAALAATIIWGLYA